MKIIVSLMFVAVMVCSGHIYPAFAAELGDKLQLAPQSEGPSLDETLNWLKQKINSITGNSGTYQNITTEFSYDKNKYYFNQEYTSSNRFRRNYICDMSSSLEASNDKSSIIISFPGYGCKQSRGIVCGNVSEGSWCYGNDVSTVGAIVLFHDDNELADKIVKAFNHAAKLIKAMPKKRSDDLF